MTSPADRDDDAAAPVRIEVRAEGNAQAYVAGRDQYITQEAPAPVTALRTLPRDVAAFTGRQSEADQILAAAQPSQVVSIHAINGMPGVGKTALAVHTARQLTSHYPDGQLFLRLGAHVPGQNPADPADALAALLLNLGVDPRSIPEDLDARAGLWRDRLTGRRMLLVLDDAADHAQVEPLLPGSEGCLVLVTSRHRLSALDGAIPLPLDTLPPQDAALLFTRLARRTSTTAADTQALARIMELCGFLPLAIVLLAGRFAHHPNWNLTDYAEEFAATQDQLSELAAGDRAVEAAFDMSYTALPPRRQRLFRLLGLHPGSDIDAYATAALAGIPLVQTRRELEALYTDHLINEPAPGRYRLHDLIRAYAHTLAQHDPADDRDAATGRLLNYYQHTTGAADRHITDLPHPATPPSSTSTPVAAPALATHQQAMAWMRAERDNLIACIQYAHVTAQHSRTIRLTAALAAFLRRQGPWDEASALHQNAVTAALHAGDHLGQADALRDLGDVRYLTGDFPAAADLAQRALNLYQSLGHRLGEAGALRDLGRVRRLTGDLMVAADLLQQAQDRYRTVGHRLGEANALWALSEVRYVAGDFPAAADLAQRALDLYQSLGHRLGEAGALRGLGHVRYLTGNYPAAADLLQQALNLYSTLGDHHGEAGALWALGHVRHLAGDSPAAADLAQRALNRYRALGHRLGEAGALWVLGQIRYATGDYSASARVLQRALSLCRNLGDRLGEANALQDLGRVRHATGDYPAAADLLQRSLALFREVGDTHGEAEVLNSTGALLAASTKPDEALAAYQQALRLSQQVRSPLDEAHALEGTARCHARAGDHPAALTALRQAVAIHQRLGTAEAPTAAEYLAVLETEVPVKTTVQDSTG